MKTGKWTATDSGVGAGCDSYYEYLVKGGLMLGNRKLLDQYYGKITKHHKITPVLELVLHLYQYLTTLPNVVHI